MLTPRGRARLGLGAAAGVFLAAVSIILAGSFDRADSRTGMPGSAAASFRLPDVDGHIVSSSAMRGNIVILYFAHDANTDAAHQQAARLAEIGAHYANTAPVKLLAIQSNSDDLDGEGRRQVHEFAAEAGPYCHTLLDPIAHVARRFAIQNLPVCLVIDASGIIRFRGGMDEASVDAPAAATSFKSVVDLLLAERAVSVPPDTGAAGTIK